MKQKLLMLACIFLAMSLFACGKIEKEKHETQIDGIVEQQNIKIDDRHYEYLRYTKKGNYITLNSLKTTSEVLVIPAYINNFPVKAIDLSDDIAYYELPFEKRPLNWQMDSKQRLKKIIFSKGIQEIKDIGYISVDEMILPENLVKIDAGAFEDCDIEKVIVNGKNTNIGSSAFKNSSLKEIQLPEDYHGIIESSCFANSKLEIFHWPSYSDGGERFIQYGAFEDCKKLKEIIFPENMKNIFICKDVFHGCTALKSLAFPETTGKVVFENSSYADNYRQGVSTLIFKGKDTELVGLEDEKERYDFITVGKIIAPKESKAIKFAKRAKKIGYISKDIKSEIKESGGMILAPSSYSKGNIRLVPMEYEEK